MDPSHVGQSSVSIPSAAAAAAAAAAAGVNVNSPNNVALQQQQSQLQQQHFLQSFWAKQIAIAEQSEFDFKNHPLPLARIKKVMKSDQEVKMISAEAPILFAKACEIFITELTSRAWMHAEENKRRTLQRSDVSSAVSSSDQFDFLIDIVPREDVSKSIKRAKEEINELYGDPQPFAYYQQPHNAIPQYTQNVVDQRVDPNYYAQLQPDQFQWQFQQQLQQQYQQRPPSVTHPSAQSRASFDYSTQQNR